MIKAGLLLILSIAIFSSTLVYANSSLGDLVTTAWPLNDPLEDGDFPIIVGNVKDQSGKPVAGAQVKIAFSTETISTTTNNVGSFYIELKTPALPGDYTVSVVSIKEGYGMSITNTKYFVNGLPPIIPKVDLTTVNQVPTIIHDGLTKNPLSQIIIQHMEKIKKQQDDAVKKQQEIKERNDFIENQRQLAKKSLDVDLQVFKKESEFNTPRLAFERFVKDVDDTVQFVFWGQFNLTEKKHNEAYAAKMTALDEGKDSIAATKIFQRKAAITKSEIVAHNSELNVKYGLADKTTQSYFDQNGKIRWGEDSLSNKTVFWYLPPK